MADTDNQQTAQKPSAETNQFIIQKVYVKDISFETPNSPQIFLEKWVPEVNLQLRSTATQQAEDVHEIVLTLTITATQSGKTAYLIEVQQAGVFTIKGFNEHDMKGMLGSYCPNILFPYGREVISDLVAKGGFPQLLLAPVNFDALYAHMLSQQTQAAEDTAH
ncbi:MAG: protein-export chaperone SecB [Gammaproteobacteria bacterium]